MILLSLMKTTYKMVIFIDVIFGPLDDYSLAPVSRFAAAWDLPIISPGGLAPAFTITKQVPMTFLLFSLGSTFPHYSHCLTTDFLVSLRDSMMNNRQ